MCATVYGAAVPEYISGRRRTMRKYIKIHPSDHVAVALVPLPAGTTVEADGKQIRLSEDIPQGHKFALTDLSVGDRVLKYGAPIGIVTKPVRAGTWVHIHNLKTGLGEILSYSYRKPTARPAWPPVSEAGHAAGETSISGNTSEHFCFHGFRRTDGQAGIRNELWILPAVGCVSHVAAALEKRAQTLVCGSVEAVCAFSHPYGCSQMGEDQENTRRILADLIRHPNAGGVLVLGLGCENSGVEVLKTYLGAYDERRVKFLVCQEAEDELEDGMRLLEELAAYASSFQREPIGCEELVVGLKCGGSDGLSGITANPTVGVCSDLLVACGGATILTEVPEMFGAETLLMDRCENEEVFRQTVSLINDFKEYFIRHQQTIYENPSPGNKQGGISTLEDKALGCTQKSGSAPVRGVLSYGERLTNRGLHLLSAPGNDLVSSTALAAAGAHLILFTTGRGTPFGAPVPTLKLSSNSELFRKKNNWIDFDCGVLTESGTPQELGRRLFAFVLSAASGEKVKSEKAGYHGMAIFRQGVTL